MTDYDRLARNVTHIRGCTYRTHGKTGTPEYKAWGAIIQRCRNEKDRRYKFYGARGIYVCERWMSFENFYADMGDRPSEKHSIDRIDNDGPYAPENCRWATRREQYLNRRGLHIISVNNESHCVSEWARRSGISRNTIFDRLARGWSEQDAVTKGLVNV